MIWLHCKHEIIISVFTEIMFHCKQNFISDTTTWHGKKIPGSWHSVSDPVGGISVASHGF